MDTVHSGGTLSCMTVVLHQHADSRKVFVKVLSHFGFDAAAFSSGEEALTAMKRQRPRLVILNGTLDDMSGLELLERLREDGALADVPVYFISSNTDCQFQAERLGILAYGVKPILAEDLLRVVRSTPERALAS